MAAPKIRFKKDDGSDYPAWKEDTLNNLCDYVDYRGKTPEKVEKGVFLITAKNIKMGFIDYSVSQEYVTESSYEEVMHRGKPQVGDVLFTTEAPLGSVAQLDREDVALAQRVIKYRTKLNSILSNTFLKYSLMSPKFQSELNQKATGGTVQGIKGATLHKMTIKYPYIEEQQKIADFLSDVDELISTSEEEVANLEAQKKAAMRKLFSQEVRFKKPDGSEFPDWVTKKMPEIATLINGRAYLADEMLQNGKYMVLRVGNLFSNTEYFYSDLELDSDKYIDDGDLIYAWSATFGPRIYHGEKCIYHYHIWKVIPHNVDKLFLLYALYHDIPNIQSELNGGTMHHITKMDMEKRSFSVPCIEEQHLIADFLSTFDEAINAAKDELAKYRELKKGLLQQMFV